MKINECIALISVIVFIIGWFINNYIKYRYEISKKRFEYRINALQSFLNVWFIIQKESSPFTNDAFLPALEKARTNFQLYGTNDEIEKFE